MCFDRLWDCRQHEGRPEMASGEPPFPISSEGPLSNRCLDCHREHSIWSPKSTKSPVLALLLTAWAGLGVSTA